MKYIYSAYDSKANCFMQPFTVLTQGIAERSFEQAVFDGQTEISKYPEDYSLVYLGTFNEVTGEIDPSPTRPFIKNGMQTKAEAMERQKRQNMSDEEQVELFRQQEKADDAQAEAIKNTQLPEAE